MTRREPVRYLVVGGGPAGHLAAQEIRRADPEGSIRIITDEPCRFYNRTLLSKEFLLGADVERLFLKDPSFYQRRAIELETQSRVVAVDGVRRTAALSDGSEQPWEKLLVATGAEPIRPALEGAEAEGVCVLRSLADATAIRERAAAARRAVCVGGGFIGVEVACALRELGLEVDLAMLESRVWHFLTPQAVGEFLAERLRERGVRLHTAREVAGFGTAAGRVRDVRFRDGGRIEAELVVLGIGVRPAVACLRGSGIPLGRGVRTDAALRTAVPDVCAAGDVAEFEPPGGGPPRLVGHWANAWQQGRVAGANLAGRTPPLAFAEVPWCDSRVFDLEVAFVGDPRPDRPFVFRGGFDERGFIAFSLEGERLVGTIHVNRTGEVPAAIELVRSGRPVDPRTLAAGEPDELASLASARGG